MKHDDVLNGQLRQRKEDGLLRTLYKEHHDLIDFCSNDYLGLARNAELSAEINQEFQSVYSVANGSASSRLVRANTPYLERLEEELAAFCVAEAALIYNSGYSANLGFFSCVPQRNDVVLYDEYIHASIRAGLQLSKAKSYSFAHNSISELEQKLQKVKGTGRVFVAVESVYSMDGDSPDLKGLATFCAANELNLVVDEAHAFGLFGEGKGLIAELGLEDQVYARVITFGKALGVSGAAVLGSDILKQYQVNHSSPFIYTTGMSPHEVVSVRCAFEKMKQIHTENGVNKELILRFKEHVQNSDLDLIESESWIQSVVISGNENAKKVEQKLRSNGLDVKAILSPTVPVGKERIRICFHVYNSEKEVELLIKSLLENE